MLRVLVTLVCFTSLNGHLLTKREVINPTECKNYVRFSNRTLTKCLRNNYTEEVTSCDVYKHATDEVSASFDVLVLFPDRDILLSETDSHHDEHCEDAKKNLKVFEKHAKCVEGPAKQFIDPIAKGLKRVVNKRCTSKSWHRKYIQFSTCLKDHNIKNAFHVCEDRVTAAYEYSLKNIAKENQTQATCCFNPVLSECFYNETSHVCGKNLTNYMIHNIYSPVIRTFLTLCKGKDEEHCDAATNAKFHEIFTQKHENQKRGLYQVMYEAFSNHPREDIVVEEHE